MKGTYEEVTDAWDKARLSSMTRIEFQEKWTAALDRLGWTRQEFHEELDRRNNAQLHQTQ
jgi:hypothetical protein